MKNPYIIYLFSHYNTCIKLYFSSIQAKNGSEKHDIPITLKSAYDNINTFEFIKMSISSRKIVEKAIINNHPGQTKYTIQRSQLSTPATNIIVFHHSNSDSIEY